MSLDVKKGAIMAGGSMIYQQGISFLSGLILARLMGPSDYGLFNLLRNYAMTVCVATKGGMDIGILRRLGETSGSANKQQSSDLVLGSCAISLFGGAFVWLVVWLGVGQQIENSFYPNSGFGRLIGIMFIILPFLGLLQVGAGALKGRGFIGSSVLIELILHPTLRLIFSLAFLFLGLGLVGVIIGNVIASLVAAMVTLFVIFKRFSFIFRGNWLRDLIGETKPVLKYSIVLAVSVFIVTATRSMDVFFLGRYSLNDELGAYALIQVVVGVLPLFGSAFGQVMGPTVAKLWVKNDKPAVAALVRDNIRLVALTTLPIFLMLSALGDFIIHGLWPKFPISFSVLMLLASSQLIFGVFSNAGWILSMTGRHRMEAYILSIGLLTTFVCCYWLVPRFGSDGAAVSTLMGVFVQTGIRLAYVSSMLSVNPFPKAVIMFTILGGVAAYITRTAAEKFLGVPTLISSLMISCVFIMTMLGFAFKFGLSKEERLAVAKGVSRISNKMRGSE